MTDSGPPSSGLTRTRPLVVSSWRRMRRVGLKPDGGPEIAPLATDQLAGRREHSPLAHMLPLIRRWLTPACEGCQQAMVIADSHGRVLWREGGSPVSRLADRLGFVDGSYWSEPNVGTNAIGTALVLGEPVQIHGREHFVESHTLWTCAAAPVHHPVTGEAIGVVDLSGPARTAHPNTLALVGLTAHAASLELSASYEIGLAHLRAQAAPVLAKLTGRALVVSPEGMTAAAIGFPAPRQVVLPDNMVAGNVWVAALGHVVAEPIPGGWLLRMSPDIDAGDTDPVTQIQLRLDGPDRWVRIETPSGQWAHRPSWRHAQILAALARHRQGRSAAELANDLFADPSRTVTVRAEMSRLRRILGSVLQAQPYRFAETASVQMLNHP